MSAVEEFAQTLEKARNASAKGDPQLAVHLYQEALALQPTQIAAIVGLGHGLRSLGQGREAARAYRDAIRLKPDSGAAWWALANMKTIPLGPGDLDVLHAQMARPQTSPLNAALLYFSTGKALDDIGDEPAAFSAYVAGNDIMAELRPYQEHADRQLFDELVDHSHSVGSKPHSPELQTFPTPVFIVGMPRSGSTLVEQILGSHTLIGGGGEFAYLAETLVAAADAVSVPVGRQTATLRDNQVQQIRQAYFDGWRPHIGTQPVFIDKQLNNFWLVGQIARCFPSSPIIDVRRHPFDACLGAFKQIFAQGQEFTYSFQSYAAYHDMYLRMMAYWKAQLPDQIHSIYLEQLVDEPRLVLEPILAKLGIDWTRELLDFHQNSRIVHSASSEQVRSPINKAIGYRFGWQATETAPMRDLLAAAAAPYPFQPIFRPQPGEHYEPQPVN